MDAAGFEWIDTAAEPLRRPVFVIALQGLFDMAGVATDVIDGALEHSVSTKLAGLDPDPFYDFCQHRPNVFIDADGERRIRWPTNDVIACRGIGVRDLVMVSGIEPDVRWRTFVAALIDAVRRLGCEVVVTLGAVAEAIPHSRTPQVFGSTTDGRLARRLGLSRPQYQGPTGVIGVLNQQLESAGIPAISLRVGVPHYLLNARHPRSTMALTHHLEHVLGVKLAAPDLAAEIDKWRRLHDAAVASDSQAAAFVTMLEREFDRRVEASMPSAEALAAEFERFLDERRGETG